MFTFIVFVGDGCLALVTAHLPHLRLLCLEECDSECDEHIAELMAAVLELVVINCRGDIVGAERIKQLKITAKRCTFKEYFVIRQWALDT
jgi:hypothetical protein